MTTEQFTLLVQRYLDFLESVGAKPVRTQPSVVPSGRDALGHARWMCSELLSMTSHSDYDREKAHRWLGFIQSILWSQGKLTIDELRQDVMRV